jgi:hypothetical protein
VVSISFEHHSRVMWSSLLASPRDVININFDKINHVLLIGVTNYVF